jgi:hypothetical protein
VVAKEREEQATAAAVLALQVATADPLPENAGRWQGEAPTTGPAALPLPLSATKPALPLPPNAVAKRAALPLPPGAAVPVAKPALPVPPKAAPPVAKPALPLPTAAPAPRASAPAVKAPLPAAAPAVKAPLPAASPIASIAVPEEVPVAAAALTIGLARTTTTARLSVACPQKPLPPHADPETDAVQLSLLVNLFGGKPV